MRVYVETNFVLELALEQEQHAACEAILRLAEARAIEVVLPAYSMVEAFHTLQRKESERKRLMDTNNRELREVARMAGHARSVDDTRNIISDLLVTTVEAARKRLDRIARRLSDSGSLLPLTGAEIGKTAEFEKSYGMSPPDALILASVLGDPRLGRTASCFLNRNTKDFDEPRIRDLLAQHACTLLGNFASGHQYIQARRVHAG